MSKVCITGAGGTVGREVLRQLAAAAVPLRAAFFSNHKVAAARAEGIDAVAIDYARPETLHPAFEGCERLYLLGPNEIEQTRLELNAVEAAKQAGVRHIVKQSVVGAADEAFEIAAVHRPVELAIESSGLAWTFLRPNSFMQNVMTFMAGTIRTDDAFYSASGTGRIAHVDVRDIAAVAVRALTVPGHEGRAYTLTGPEALGYDELADALSAALGRTIRHVSLPPAELKGALLADGLSEPIAERLLDLERFYRENRASRVTDDVERVTGQAPRRLAPYLRECAAALQPVAR